MVKEKSTLKWSYSLLLESVKLEFHCRSYTLVALGRALLREIIAAARLLMDLLRRRGSMLSKEELRTYTTFPQQNFLIRGDNYTSCKQSCNYSTDCVGNYYRHKNLQSLHKCIFTRSSCCYLMRIPVEPVKGKGKKYRFRRTIFVHG